MDIPRATRLVFESEYVVRTVGTYPANWRELSGEELYVLSWTR